MSSTRRFRSLSSPAHELPELIVAPPSRVGRNVSVLALGQLITWTMTLLWTFVVPRALGPSGLGVVMSAWSICGIFGILLGLGTKNYLVRTALVEPDAAPGRIGTAMRKPSAGRMSTGSPSRVALQPGS